MAALRDGTPDTPEHSATYRRFVSPRGVDDELRAVLRADGQWWGQVSLFRERGRRPFTKREIATAADALAPLGKHLRTFAGLRPPLPSSHGGTTIAGGPGLLLFDLAGGLLSINDEARELLAAMPESPSSTSRFGLRVPAWIHSTAARAQTDDHTRVRAQDRTGRWLVCHASCPRDQSGNPTRPPWSSSPRSPRTSLPC